MLIAILVASVVLGIGLVAIWTRKTKRDGEGTSRAPAPPDAEAAECVLCHTPLRGTSTNAEVLSEIEHRIDVDRKKASEFLAEDPERAESKPTEPKS